MNRNRINLLFILFILSIVRVEAQDELVLDLSKNTIRQKESLYPILDQLQQNKSRQISIVHIGDSHIQADFFTGRIREGLQNQFGDAGRGLIFPYKFVQTNGPRDYRFTDNSCQWKGMRIMKADSLNPVGIPGIKLELNTANCGFTIQFYDDSFSLEKGFSDLDILFEGEADFEILDLNSRKLFSPQSDSLAGKTRIKNFRATRITDLISFRISNAKPGFVLKGLNLHRNSPGVLYHAIGLNGATFNDYLKSPAFTEELLLLKPELLVVSLGTNESVSAIDSATYISQIKQLLSPFRENGIPILLTGPADNARRKTIRTKRGKKIAAYTHNEKVQQLNQWMNSWCAQEGIAYWDLYETMGGKNSIKEWVKYGLAARDHIHFSKKGYILQADLLLDAFLH